MSDTNRGGHNVSASGIPITGQVGAVPPPGAPYEVSQPLQPETIAAHAALAKQNARELQPLKFPATKPPVAPDAGTGQARPAAATLAMTSAPVVPGQVGGTIPDGVQTASPVVVGGGGVVASAREAVRAAAAKVLRRPANASGVERPAVPDSEVGGTAVRLAAVLGSADAMGVLASPVIADAGDAARPALPAPEPEPEFPPLDPTIHPAGSNSDSPSRGQPRYEPDPNKRVTGGFGMAEDARGQYFALDGTELLELVRSLLDEVNEKIANDLRFSVAICYPRVTARVRVEIQGFAQDPQEIITKFRTSDKNSVEVASGLCEEIVFVMQAQAEEVDAAGNSVRPPNAIREALGLSVPRKQVITDANRNRHWVDVPS